MGLSIPGSQSCAPERALPGIGAGAWRAARSCARARARKHTWRAHSPGCSRSIPARRVAAPRIAFEEHHRAAGAPNSYAGRIDDHQTGEDPESYSLGRLVPYLMPGFEQHLLICQRCRMELNAIEPCNFIHYTRDGPFYSRITKLPAGTLFARHWGRSLGCARSFAGARARKHT